MSLRASLGNENGRSVPSLGDLHGTFVLVPRCLGPAGQHPDLSIAVRFAPALVANRRSGDQDDTTYSPLDSRICTTQLVIHRMAVRGP